MRALAKGTPIPVAGAGAALVFFGKDETTDDRPELWIALEDSLPDPPTPRSIIEARESFIAATSAADVDALIEALKKARALFG